MKEYKYKINGTEYTVAVGDINDGVAEVSVNGCAYKVEVPQKVGAPVIKAPKAAPAPRTATGAPVIAKPAAKGGGSFAVKAPLPGTVLQILVNVGDTVKASDTVVTLEAMKMENAIKAEKDGTVASIDVKKGDAVMEGTTLITIN